MKNFKKLVAMVTVVGILGVSGAVYAAGQKAPIDVVTNLTGKTIEEVSAERNLGKTYGTIAKESGKLDEFKTEMLAQKKLILEQQVKDGKLTKEKADEIYNAIKNNQATCDGTGNAKVGQKYGVGFGKNNGMRKGQGSGMCNGSGMKSGKNFNKQ